MMWRTWGAVGTSGMRGLEMAGTASRGPVMGMPLVCVRAIEAARVAGMGMSTGEVGRVKVREVTGPAAWDLVGQGEDDGFYFERERSYGTVLSRIIFPFLLPGLSHAHPVACPLTTQLTNVKNHFHVHAYPRLAGFIASPVCLNK